MSLNKLKVKSNDTLDPHPTPFMISHMKCIGVR